MKCEQIQEQMLDLAARSGSEGARAEPAAEQAQHLAACGACAAKLAELRSTMALLDGWHAPEPSPYFDARLRARMREEAQNEAPRGFMGLLKPGWFKTPAVLRPLAAAALTLIVAAGIGFYDFTGNPDGGMGPAPTPQAISSAQAAPPEGSAVADLQALDKNADVLADFDLLDDLAASQQSAVQR
ncbi:MAG: hypothetical protein M3P27_07880 [Acidobacteriota bacterium]|nr:hypothetical protein [Acidobacteriota bacterium]